MLTMKETFNQIEFDSRKFDVSFCGSIIIKKNFHSKNLDKYGLIVNSKY